jgi:hypothetical protein
MDKHSKLRFLKMESLGEKFKSLAAVGKVKMWTKKGWFSKKH